MSHWSAEVSSPFIITYYCNYLLWARQKVFPPNHPAPVGDESRRLGAIYIKNLELPFERHCEHVKFIHPSGGEETQRNTSPRFDRPYPVQTVTSATTANGEVWSKDKSLSHYLPGNGTLFEPGRPLNLAWNVLKLPTVRLKNLLRGPLVFARKCFAKSPASGFTR